MKDIDEIIGMLKKGMKIYIRYNKVRICRELGVGTHPEINQKTFFRMLSEGFLGITGGSQSQWVLADVFTKKT